MESHISFHETLTRPIQAVVSIPEQQPLTFSYDEGKILNNETSCYNTRKNYSEVRKKLLPPKPKISKAEHQRLYKERQKSTPEGAKRYKEQQAIYRANYRSSLTEEANEKRKAVIREWHKKKRYVFVLIYFKNKYHFLNLVILYHYYAVVIERKNII